MLGRCRELTDNALEIKQIKHMRLFKILYFIINHPLNRNRKLKSLCRFFCWQISSRLVCGSIAVNFVNEARLLISSGMMGATGNIYVGLHEFEDMAFVLHCLRRNDVFVDIGANVGTYTVLAGAVIGATCVSIEPIPDTFKHLMDNVNLNGIYENVHCFNVGIGRKNETLRITSTLGAMNHVVVDENDGVQTIEIPVKKLDDVIGGLEPVLIKIDVEGFETEVIAGAHNVLSKTSLLAVIIELVGSGERYGYDELVIHQEMLAYGFRPFAYNPINRNLIPLETKHIKKNTLYVKNSEQVSERVKTAPKFFVNGQEL